MAAKLERTLYITDNTGDSLTLESLGDEIDQHGNLAAIRFGDGEGAAVYLTAGDIEALRDALAEVDQW